MCYLKILIFPQIHFVFIYRFDSVYLLSTFFFILVLSNVCLFTIPLRLYFAITSHNQWAYTLLHTRHIVFNIIQWLSIYPNHIFLIMSLIWLIPRIINLFFYQFLFKNSSFLYAPSMLFLATFLSKNIALSQVSSFSTRTLSSV